MKNRLSFGTVAILMSILSSCSTISVSKIDPDATKIKPPHRNGVSYCLPKTRFEIQVTIEKTQTEPSLFFKADNNKFNDAVTKKTPWLVYYTKSDSTFNITALKLIPEVVPDSTQLYYAAFRRNNALFLKRKETFTLSNGLYLTEGSMSFEDRTANVLIDSGIKLAKAVAAAQAFNNQNDSILMVELHAILDRIVVIRKIKKVILDGKAEEKIYNSEFSLLLTKLEQEEQELVEQVRGKKQVSIEKHTFHVDPKVGRNVMFYFTQSDGISDDDIDQRAVYFTISQNSLKPRLDSLLNKKENQIKSRNHGIYYRIPYTTELVVRWDKKDLLRSEVTIPQLGSVAFLPSKVSFFASEISYTLDEKTGALITFKANGEGISLESTKKILDAASQLSEDKIKRLENEIKLKELQEKLDSLNGTTR